MIKDSDEIYNIRNTFLFDFAISEWIMLSISRDKLKYNYLMVEFGIFCPAHFIMSCTFSKISIWPSPTPQLFIRWVGGEDQAKRESYIEIHQPYPSNHANSRHNKTNKARKLWFHMKLKIYHIKLSLENDQVDLST